MDTMPSSSLVLHEYNFGGGADVTVCTTVLAAGYDSGALCVICLTPISLQRSADMTRPSLRARPCRSHRDLGPWQGRTVAGALVALLVYLAALTPVTGVSATRNAVGADGATRVLAPDPFLPFTGTAVVTWHATDVLQAPPDVAQAIGWHREIVRFAVRDMTHYRVDVQMTAPALEAGTRTIAVNGTRIVVYDTRTGTAATPSPQDAYVDYFLRAGLPLVMSGNDQRNHLTYGLPAQLPNPREPLTRYLRSLRGDPMHTGVPHTATVSGHGTLLGNHVEVVDYGPVIIDVHGCAQPNSAACKQSMTGSGDARIWLDQRHTFILKYRLLDMPDAIRTPALPRDTLFRVTHITYGRGPAASDLQFQPPVPVVQSDGTLMSGIGGGHDPNPPPPPKPFFRAPPPRVSSLAACFLTQLNDEGVPPGTAGLSYLFAHDPTGTCNQLKAGTPYVLVQEHIQVQGLPAALRNGQPHAAGRCQVWTGSAAHGQGWAAFAQGPVSARVTTNTLSENDLLQYIATRLCSST